LQEACDVIVLTAKGMKDATKQMQLINKSIALPLELGAADQAERQLNQFRHSIPSLPLINYYEGRILFLRKQHDAAIRKLVKVVEGERYDPNGSRVLQQEALTWIQRIRDDKMAIRLLQTAVEDKNKLKPKKIVPTETPSPSKKPAVQSPE
jgi:predicted Zn-dependent protease